MINKIKTHVPILPLTAFVFYLLVLSLWQIGLIPGPVEILHFLEDLYNKYGYFGLTLATFLESIAYLGLYFPGSAIIALAVFLSDGSFITLLTISVIVAATLTVTATINYLLGRYVSRNHLFEEEALNKSVKISKGLISSMLHPNLLAFYFFNAGLERHNFKKIFFVPIFMIPYGYIFGFVLSRFSKVAKQSLESPGFLITLILIWLTTAYIVEAKRIKKGKKQSPKIIP
jgi:membrane protein DedA with SNARE-associated domain